MIGQTIESRSRLPLGAIFWLLVACLFDVLAVALGNVQLAVVSFLPWLVALLFLRGRERSVTLRFTETALVVEEPPLELPYHELQGLLAPRRPANPYKAGPSCYLIQVFHANGVLRIPARLGVRSDDVFSFLYSRFSPSGSRDVPDALVDFLRHGERRHGPERVLSYRARSSLALPKRYPGLRSFFLALFLSGIAWIVWGSVTGPTEWIGVGGFGVFFGGLISLLLWADSRRNSGGFRKWRQSGLVIAPDGLALAQGDLVGELRWDEVRDIKLGKINTTFQLRFAASNQPLSGIVLKVEGADIVIADVYDRPLALIYQNIRHYWQGPSRDDDDWDHEGAPPQRTDTKGSISSRAPLPPSSRSIKPPE